MRVASGKNQTTAPAPTTRSTEAPKPATPSAASPAQPARHDPLEDEPDPLEGVAPRPLGKQELAVLVDALPLRLNDLDFTRIRRFLDLYVAVLAGDTPERRVSVVSNIKQARMLMRMATQLTASQAENFPMDGLTAQDIITWARPPRSASAVPLADCLDGVVRAVEQIMADFRNRLPTTATHEERQALEQQAGGDHIPHGSSVSAWNIDHLRAARARIPQAQ